MIGDLLRLVVNDLLRKKFSSFMTFFAISLGIFIIFLIVLVSAGFESSIEDFFDQYGANRVYITSGSGIAPDGSTALSDREVELIEQRPFVDKAYGYVTRRGTLTMGSEDRPANLIGYKFDGEFFDTYNLDFSQGREPSQGESNAVVFGSQAAEEIFSREIRLGTSVELRGERFRIVGVLEPVGNQQDDNQVYFDLDTLRDLYDLEDNLEMIEVILAGGEDLDFAVENLENILSRELDEDSYNIITPDDLLDQVRNILSIIQYSLGGIAFISLIVGSIGIINTMFVIVTEKTKDIGIMKSVGARNRDILLMFVMMSGSFGFFGALLGVILGSIGAVIFENVAQEVGFDFLEIPIDPMVIVYTLLFGILIGVISGYFPSRKASKITIIDTLRK